MFKYDIEKTIAIYYPLEYGARPLPQNTLQWTHVG